MTTDNGNNNVLEIPFFVGGGIQSTSLSIISHFLNSFAIIGCQCSILCQIQFVHNERIQPISIFWLNIFIINQTDTKFNDKKM